MLCGVRAWEESADYHFDSFQGITNATLFAVARDQTQAGTGVTGSQSS